MSGRSIRTNNSAESVHDHLNAKVNGTVTLHRFLSIIEDQMLQGRKRIRKGCESQSRAVEQVKNRLLAEELDKLLNGRVGVLDYLDNCASITCLQTVERANRIELMTTVPDVWVETHRALLGAAGRGLYHRLFARGQLLDTQIQTNITTWSFQVLDPIVVDQGDDEDLSLVEDGPHQSFLEQRRGHQDDFTQGTERDEHPTDRNDGHDCFRAGPNPAFHFTRPVFFPLIFPFPGPVPPAPFGIPQWPPQPTSRTGPWFPLR